MDYLRDSGVLFEKRVLLLCFFWEEREYIFYLKSDLAVIFSHSRYFIESAGLYASYGYSVRYGCMSELINVIYKIECQIYFQSRSDLYTLTKHDN